MEYLQQILNIAQIVCLILILVMALFSRYAKNEIIKGHFLNIVYTLIGVQLFALFLTFILRG